MHSAADYVIKVAVVGDSGVGKTSLVARFTKAGFDEHVPATIGIDYSRSTLQYLDGALITLHIWDTAGQERFRCVTPSFYRGCHAVVFAFCDRESLDSVQRHWIPEAELYMTHDGAVCVFVQTKCDTEPMSFLSSALRCSAKTGDGIGSVFTELCSRVLARPDLLADARVYNAQRRIVHPCDAPTTNNCSLCQ